MFVVDASVWVGVFMTQDAHHLPSRRWLGRQIEHNTPIILPSLTLAETAGAVARRTGRVAAAREATNIMLELPFGQIVPIDEELARLGAEAAGQLRLKGIDALYWLSHSK